MRRLFRALFGLALRIFFRRIEVDGAERVPLSGPVIFVVNHPNALVDPLCLLCLAPRPVSFLAKAPLFRMPVIGFFVRGFDSIPVSRRQDPGSDLTKNRETFERARELLAHGGSLAIFPEGASHDEPKLLPLKTGAARIALGAAAQGNSPLQIVPAGLYYTWKMTFRSSALLTFGEPIPVFPVPLGSDGEPPADAVRELTEAIRRALSQRTLQSETHGAHDLVRRAEKIFSVREEKDSGGLARELEMRRRFVAGYRQLRERDPARLEAIEARIARFDAERRMAGLRLEDLVPEQLGSRAAARLLARNLGDLLLLPLAAVGAVTHYPAYRLVGWVAGRVARKEEDLFATVKVASSMLFFPLTWVAGAIALSRLFGPWAAAGALCVLPLSGYAALRVAESLDEMAGRVRALTHLIVSGYAMKRLLAERRAIREEMVKVAEELKLMPNDSWPP